MLVKNYTSIHGWLLLLLVGTLMGCQRVTLLRLFLQPTRPFNATHVPPAPRYAESIYWHESNRRFANRSVDAFFVHPTTYITGKSWNQDLTNKTVNWRTRVLSVAYQASVFYPSCNTFIPKYRQAIFASFVDKKENGEQALELAYQDIRAAFDYYWTHHNQGRPFFLAGHSQGSYHIKRLLIELMADSTIKRQLIAAYAIGWPIEHTYPSTIGLTVCSTATQTQCLASWNAQSPKATGTMAESLEMMDSMVCVNPLSWTIDGTYNSPEKNKGALMTNLRRKEPELLLHFCSAQIKGSVLEVTLASKGRRLSTPIRKGNYHLYDYNLFYQSIQENIAQRIVAHTKAAPAPTGIQ